MDTWEQRIENSQAVREAREIRTVVQDNKARQISNEEQDYLDRIDFVVGLVLLRLKESDPRLISENTLNSMNSSLANLHSYVNSWAQAQSVEYLSNHSQGMVDNLLTYLAGIPQQDVAVVGESVSALRRSVAGYRLAVDRETKALDTTVAEIRSSFDEQAKTAEQSVADLTAKVEDAEENLAKVETASQDFIARQQTVFSKAETDRSTAFSQLITEKSKDLENTITKLGDDTKTSIESIQKEVADKKDAAEKAVLRIQKIVGIVGEGALIARYSKNATRELKAADFWRWVTVSAIGLVVIAAFALAIAARSAANWQEFVAKAIFTVSLGAFAGYAARQSGEHRNAQRDAEQMALTLAALKPYLQDMEDPAERDQLMHEIAARIFSHERSVEGKTKSVKIDNPMLMGQLITLLQELVKANTKA